MNTAKVLELADFLDTVSPENFNLNNWGTSPETLVNLENCHTCGTTLCVAGWAVVKEGFTVNADTEEVLGSKERRRMWLTPQRIVRKAQILLELTDVERKELFFPKGLQRSIYSEAATHDPKKAAQYIRQYVSIYDPDGFAAYQDSKKETNDQTNQTGQRGDFQKVEQVSAETQILPQRS